MRFPSAMLLALTAYLPTPLDGDGISSSAPLSAWTELGAGGKAFVRAVVNGPCPLLLADGHEIPMLQRAATSRDFSAAVCEAEAPAGATDLRVGNQRVPAGNPPARRVLFIGDTGCRLKAGAGGKVTFQNCNDPASWPFAGLAAAAAAWKPDLVVHVGDYHYREANCPAGEARCAGSETGDRWPSWEQDFFTPAAPLLAAAPWIFVRGNHEICARAGTGWFLLLDAGPLPPTCTDASPPFSVPLPGHRLYVLDSADASNIEPSLAQVAPAPPGEITWLLLHRPFLTPGADDEVSTQAELPLHLASPGAIGAVFTGHRHLLAINEFEDERPPEIITGNSGDTLETLASSQSERLTNFNFHDFGFLTLERDAQSGAWIMQEHDRKGTVVGTCSLRESPGKKTELSCSS